MCHVQLRHLICFEDWYLGWIQGWSEQIAIFQFDIWSTEKISTLENCLTF